ncbi:MAG: hypothetical protein J5711_05820 [Bacteroidales bacterium]|nr:hypothetical protein [Bacteroidales bacterium]
MREGRAIPHTDLKQGGGCHFCSSACLSFLIGAPATGRDVKKATVLLLIAKRRTSAPHLHTNLETEER